MNSNETEKYLEERISKEGKKKTSKYFLTFFFSPIFSRKKTPNQKILTLSIKLRLMKEVLV